MLKLDHRKTNIIYPIVDRDFRDLKDDGKLTDSLVQSDIDIIRLNFTLRQLKQIAELEKSIMKIRQDKGRAPNIMMDLFPPSRARLGKQQSRKEVFHGQNVIFSQSTEEETIQVDTVDIASLFEEGERAYLGYGHIEVLVDKIEQSDKNVLVHATVDRPGILSAGMSLNVPATRSKILDKTNPFGAPNSEIVRVLGNYCDYVVVPSFASTEAILDLKATFKEAGFVAPWCILKVDSKEIYEKYEEYLPVVDGVLISRRELSRTVNPSLLPVFTKEIIKVCNDHAKTVLISSEILASMSHQQTPTRAEVSDLANAVMDGADAIVISEDIPLGEPAERALKVVRNVIRETESDNDVDHNWDKDLPPVNDEMDAVSLGALRTARRVGAKAIVCITESGNTALKLASFRPPLPIIGVTFNEAVCRRLSLIRGVEGYLLEATPNIDEVLDVVSTRLIRDSSLEEGDLIIFVSVTLSSVEKKESNLFTIQKLGQS